MTQSSSSAETTREHHPPEGASTAAPGRRGPLWRRSGWVHAAFALLCLVMLRLPLTNVLGYEYAIGCGWLLLVAAPLLLRDGAAEVSAAGGVLARWAAATRLLLAPCGVALALGLANMVFVVNCDPWAGVQYWAIFVLSQAPILAALWVCAERLTGRWAGVAYGVVVAVSVIVSLWHLASQPPIVMYNTFLGYFAGSIYDESLVPVGQHVVFRGYTLLVALGWLLPLAWWERRGRALRWGTWAVVALCVLAYGARSELGLSMDRRGIERALGGVHEGPYLTIHYDARSFTDAELLQLVEDHDARWRELARFWGFEPERRFRSYVYGSAEQRGRLMGARSTLIARIWQGEMHITWGGPGDETLAHELAHLFLYRAGRGPLRLSSRGGVLPLMGLVEGAATAAAWGAEGLTYHGWARALMELGLAPDPSRTLNAAGFWASNSRVVYTLYGSFCRFLIDTYGPAPFLEAYGAGAFERAYGEPLEVLLRQWTLFLEGIELTEGQLAEARLRYDRPALVARRCARSVATDLESAERAVRQRETAEAERCYERVLRASPGDGTVRLRIASGLVRMREEAAAAELLDEVLAAPWSSAGQRQRARLQRADVAWRLGDHEAAAALLASMDDDALTEELERQREVRRVAIAERAERPMAEAAVRLWLATSWSAPEAVVMSALVRAAGAEGSATAAYLAGLRLAAVADPPVAEGLLRQALEELSLPSLRVRAERALALHLTLRGRREGCERWEALAAGRGPADAVGAEARMWLGRCAEW